jgi:hypothetical protein
LKQYDLKKLLRKIYCQIRRTIKNIAVEEINNWINPKINIGGFYVTEAFKILLK